MVLAAAGVEIVLPKPQSEPAELPPEAQPEAEHTFDVPQPKLPPGTKNRRLTIDALKARGKRLNRKAAEKVDLPLRIEPELYLALLETAEEYSTSLNAVAKQCIKDGLRKYREFRSPYAPNPFNDLTPFQAYNDAGIITPIGKDRPMTGEASPYQVSKKRRLLAAEELTAAIPEYDNPEMPAEWSKFLPQTSPLKSADDAMEFDPLAPVQDEEADAEAGV